MSVFESNGGLGWRKALVLLAGLGVVVYLPVFVQPFVSDDYVQIGLAREYGPVSGWSELASHPLYRFRSTSLLLTFWTERIFGFRPLPFYATSVLLHVLNTWLVFCLGAWRAIGWRASFVAAAFFAVHEGHQEAVMWYAAMPGLLAFFFLLLCLLFWIRWVESGGTRRGFYAGAGVCFLLALLSKESAAVAVPLQLLPLAVEGIRWRQRLVWLAPFALTTAAYALVIFGSQSDHLHFNDGTFSLQAPALVVWANSYGRLLWIWGVLSLLALAVWRPRRRWLLVGLALVWIAITLVPVSFLTYMLRVPSRHVYLASVGLALLVAAGWLAFEERFRESRRWAIGALAALILLHNGGYIWVKKRRQFLERAAPTERLIELARRTDGPIYVHCFPYGFEIAQRAVEMAAGKPATILRWDPPSGEDGGASATYCRGHRKGPT